MAYRIEPLSLEAFTRFFAMTETQLMEVGARRMVADAPHSAPCRVTLADAEVGDTLLLLNHDHLVAPSSPYRAGGPIFVRQNAVEAAPVVDAVPDMLGRRLVSARLYDRDAMMLDADVLEGADLDARLRDWFADDAATQIHLHTARRGCYMARAVRHA